MIRKSVVEEWSLPGSTSSLTGAGPRPRCPAHRRHPWFMPEHLPRRFVGDGEHGRCSGRTRVLATTRAFAKAIEWVERHVQPDGGFPGYIHTTFGMASVHYRMGAMDHAEPHLRHALAFLQPKSDIHDINWGLLCFYIGTVPKEHPTVTASP